MTPHIASSCKEFFLGCRRDLDKMIGDSLLKNILKPNDQFVTCSGRLNFELVQKVLMS